MTVKFPEVEIYDLLLEATFIFGGNIHTVREAGPAFVYEVGRHNTGFYIIALTEVFGTIIFDIPKETEDWIRVRSRDLHFSMKDYISKLIEMGPATFEALILMGARNEKEMEEAKELLDIITKGGKWK